MGNMGDDFSISIPRLLRGLRVFGTKREWEMLDLFRSLDEAKMHLMVVSSRRDVWRRPGMMMFRWREKPHLA